MKTRKHDELMRLIDRHAAAEVAAHSAFDGGRERFTAASDRAKKAREDVVKYLEDNFQAWSMPDQD